MKAQFGPYECTGVLGRGGMGVVYRGYETSLNRCVAIKVLAESLVHDTSVKERFLREARAMAALNDPRIIQIYFIGEEGGRTYFVMELIDGESLSSMLKRKTTLTPMQTAKIIYEAALGLAVAHDHDVVHRDIKPGNLMLTRRGEVKIADFGIALSARDTSRKLTMTGEFVGTPGYLSPEVCLGKPVDQRSDIFSLGIVLFECLTGRMPFTDESPLGLLLEVVKADAPDVRELNSEVDAELSQILQRMIAKDPDDRYQTCHALLTDLANYLAPENNRNLLIGLAQATPIENVSADAIQSIAMPMPTGSPIAPTRLTPSRRMVASQPMIGRPTTHSPNRVTKRKPWLMGSAAALILVASAWAFRDNLNIPLLSTKRAVVVNSDLEKSSVNSPSPIDGIAVPTGKTAVMRGNQPTTQVLASTGQQSTLRGSENALVQDDSQFDDALKSLDADYIYATSGTQNSLPPAHSGASYMPVPYPYPSARFLVAPAPTYYTATFWRETLGVGIGFANFWAIRPYNGYTPLFWRPLYRPIPLIAQPYSTSAGFPVVALRQPASTPSGRLITAAIAVRTPVSSVRTPDQSGQANVSARDMSSQHEARAFEVRPAAATLPGQATRANQTDQVSTMRPHAAGANFTRTGEFRRAAPGRRNNPVTRDPNRPVAKRTIKHRNVP